MGLSKNLAIVSSAVDQHCPVALRCLVRLIDHMGSSIQITTPIEVFGVRKKCCVIIESLRVLLNVTNMYDMSQCVHDVRYVLITLSVH